ncbi:hypothetical protein P4S68_13060 [Pseudoalteromonas sp. Hal099]
MQIFKREKIPPFTGYVFSGSGGVHLYWVYEPVDASLTNKQLWKSIAQIFIDSLKGISSQWEVDSTASKRLNGNLRIPGSVHGTTGLQARFLAGGPKYEFEELINYLNLGSLRDKLKIKEESTVVRLPYKPQATNLVKNSKAIWAQHQGLVVQVYKHNSNSFSKVRKGA